MALARLIALLDNTKTDKLARTATRSARPAQALQTLSVSPAREDFRRFRTDVRATRPARLVQDFWRPSAPVASLEG